MRDTLVFFGQMFRGWRAIGAIAPSGGPLARMMADKLGPVADGRVIVELGAGTGVVTRELVRRFPAARVVAVEVNPAFAGRLGLAAPGATVVIGCATELTRHLAALGATPDDVAGVISGLPLLSLPGDLPGRVLAAVRGVLRPGRPYIQFTYSARGWRRFDVAGFRPAGTRTVWRNVPPADVLLFTRDDSPA